MPGIFSVGDHNKRVSNYSNKIVFKYKTILEDKALQSPTGCSGHTEKSLPAVVDLYL